MPFRKRLMPQEVRPVAVLTREADIRCMPVKTLERHMTFVNAYRSEAGAALVGVASLVAVAAVHVAGWSRRFSVGVTTNDVAQTSERRAAVGADEVRHVPTESFRFDTLIAEDYLHHHQRHQYITIK